MARQAGLVAEARASWSWVFGISIRAQTEPLKLFVCGQGVADEEAQGLLGVRGTSHLPRISWECTSMLALRLVLPTAPPLRICWNPRGLFRCTLGEMGGYNENAATLSIPKDTP